MTPAPPETADTAKTETSAPLIFSTLVWVVVSVVLIAASTLAAHEALRLVELVWARS